MYRVYIDNILMKTYKHKLQAMIYITMKGHVYYGRGIYIIDGSRVKIIKDGKFLI